MVSNTECTMDFCHLRHKSYQPTNQKTTRMLAKTKRFRGSGKVRKARYMQSCWFKNHRLLLLCTMGCKLLCFVCVTAIQKIY